MCPMIPQRDTAMTIQKRREKIVKRLVERQCKRAHYPRSVRNAATRCAAKMLSFGHSACYALKVATEYAQVMYQYGHAE